MNQKQKGQSQSPEAPPGDLESFGIKDYHKRVAINGRFRNALRSKICLDDSNIGMSSMHGEDSPVNKQSPLKSENSIENSFKRKLLRIEDGIDQRNILNDLDLVYSQGQLDQIKRKEAARVAESNYEHPIFIPEHKNFTRLCPPERFKYSATCSICQNNCEKLFAAKGANCPFCGKVVCAKCMRRKRQIPQKPEEFTKICDNCHLDQLHIKLQERYLKKKKDRDERLLRAEKIYDKNKSEIMKMQAIYDHYKIKNERNKTEHEAHIQEIKKQINIVNEESEKVESENFALNQKFQSVNQTKRKLDELSQELKREYDALCIEYIDTQTMYAQTCEVMSSINIAIHQAESSISQMKHAPIGKLGKDKTTGNDSKPNTQNDANQFSGYSSERSVRNQSNSYKDSDIVMMSQISCSQIISQVEGASEDTNRSSEIQKRYSEQTLQTLQKVRKPPKDQALQGQSLNSCFTCFKIGSSPQKSVVKDSQKNDKPKQEQDKKPQKK